MAALNSVYSSVEGVLFNKSQTAIIQYPGGKAGSYTIPDGVISIGNYAFIGCTRLTNVTIGTSVTILGWGAFYYCSSLTSVYFQGNCPGYEGAVFDGDNNATIYYLPGTRGWGTIFGGCPTALWVRPDPVILSGSGGIQTNQFSFTTSWATNLSVVVEASTTLTNPTWSSVATNILTGGTLYFSDPQWTEYPTRFYRIRSP